MRTASAQPLERASPEPEELLQLLEDGVGSVIARTFSKMELAEEEIDAAKRRHPLAAGRIHRAFRHLCPSPALSAAPEKLFRAHCTELLERVAAGCDLRPGTTAEVLAVLSELSLRAPLERAHTLLFVKLFSDLFPEAAARMQSENEPPAADRYERERVVELEAAFRAKLRVPDRLEPRRGTTPSLFK